FYETLGYTIDEANRQAAMDIAKAQANAALGLSTAGTGAEAQIGGQAVGGFFEAVGSAVAAAVKTYSDARVKENVRAADEDIEQLLDALNAYSYEYTATVRDSPFAGPGRHVGIMAQDLARTRQ